MDKAHEWTDGQITLLESKYNKVYKEAQDIAQQRLNNYLEQFKEKDEEQRKQLKSGQITKKKYQQWRKREMLKRQKLETTLHSMSTAYYNADKLAMNYLNNALPKVLGVNFDFASCDTFGLKFSFNLYDQKTIDRLIAANPQLLPNPVPNKYANLDWYKNKLNSAITQGILHGDSIPNIAKQLNSVTQSGMAAATRNARTAITGAASWLWDQITGFFGGIVDGIKDFLGIHSPSTVFADMGKNMALGIGEGFDDEFDGIRKDMNDQMDFTATADVQVNKSRNPADVYPEYVNKPGYASSDYTERQPLIVVVQLESGLELARAFIEDVNNAKRIDGIAY